MEARKIGSFKNKDEAFKWAVNDMCNLYIALEGNEITEFNCRKKSLNTKLNKFCKFWGINPTMVYFFAKIKAKEKLGL